MIIGIIGGGRFGSLLQKHFIEEHIVHVIDKNHSPDVLNDCELVIFAVPNRALESAIKQYKKKINTSATIMDVGSVKTIPCELLQKNFTDNVLGTHPLFGPDSAGDSWQDHKMVFCRLNISDENYEQVKQLFVKRGVKAIECTPEQHDQMMAKTQALVHFIGRALTGIQEQEISTPDYSNLLKMMEKVTNDTWELFFDMQNLNPYAETERKQFLDQLKELEGKIHER